LLTAQAGWRGKISDGAGLAAGLSYYHYTHAAGNEPFYDGDPNGNTVDAFGFYTNEYRLLEVFAEYSTTLNELPLTLYADVVQNSDAGSGQDLGYTIGAKFGKASAPGTVQFGYAWLDTESDAVVGTYSDSDFAGGETDSSGHLIQAKYAIRDNVALGGTLIIAKGDKSVGPAQDYNRLMLDIAFSF